MAKARRQRINGVNRQQMAPVNWSRTAREHVIEDMTSCQPGKIVPIFVEPLLREDSMTARIGVGCEMMETHEIIANRVVMRVRGFVVPWAAMARFEGSRDQFERSYAGEPKYDGGPVVPFIETLAFGTHGANAVYKSLGLHGESADLQNTMYLEAYNLIVNWLVKNRSMDLTARTRLDTSLAPAFWPMGRFNDVVPQFDQAQIDGEIPLNVVNGQLPVKGIGARATSNAQAGISIWEPGGTGYVSGNGWTGTDIGIRAQTTGVAAAGNKPQIYAELAQNGITVSLSNLQVARKAQQWAKVRERYEGLSDEYIIENLMDGLSMPDVLMTQPIQLTDVTVPFAQAKRYATDAANLASSAVSGGAFAEFDVNIPRIGVGGIFMLVAEMVPTQLFERQQDPFLNTLSATAFPRALQDSMDPEKVEAVLNKQIDSKHSAPTTQFGFAPLHWKWRSWGPRMGGKFLRPTTDPATDTVRRRFWANEAANPILGRDFYLATTVHTKPFLDTVNDPFEISIMGTTRIVGNTQFGGPLVESGENYDAILDQVDMTRLTQA